MIKKLFKSSTPTDLLNELNNDCFNENQAQSILKTVDINFKDQESKTFLHSVAQKNSIESIKWLLKQKIDIDGVDNNGDTALIIAARNGATQAVRILLELSANTDIPNKKGKLAIHEAASNNKIESFNLLKEVTKDLNLRDKKDKNILEYIIDSKNVEVLNSLLDDQRIKVEDSIIFYNNIYSNHALLKTFIKRDFNFEIIDKDNKTALFYLLNNGLYDTSILEIFLSYNIDLNHIDKFGNNALLELVNTIIKNPSSTKKKINQKSLTHFIPYLMEEGIDASISNKKGDNVITLAVKNKNFDLVKTLLHNEVEPDILDGKKETGLTHAALIGKDAIDIVFLLLDYGASPNIKDEQNKTVIEKLIDAQLMIKNKKRVKIKERKYLDETQDYYLVLEEILANSEANLRQFNTMDEPYFFEALKHGNLDLVKLLMKHGSDINQTAKNGLNVIYNYMADNTSFRREIDMKKYYTNLKTIISMGADVNARDDYGGITLHKAILDNDDQSIKILLNSGADINAIDNRGRNILHNTIWKSKIKLFRLIYSYNKKLINTPDKFGVLPINYAAFLGYEDLVLELIDTGSQVNNPYKKTHYIFNFLKRFHKNLLPIVKNTRSLGNKQKVIILIQNMHKEFEVKIDLKEQKELEDERNSPI